MGLCAVYDPEHYCPICGARLHSGHCKDSILQAIDGARDKRDPDIMLLRIVPESQRLANGCFIFRLGLDEPDEEEALDHECPWGYSRARGI